MPEEILPEKREELMKIAKDVGDKVKEERRKKPPEPLVQKFSFDPASENKWEIEKLQKENEKLKETIRELKKELDGRVKKVEEELKDLGKMIEQKNPKQ